MPKAVLSLKDEVNVIEIHKNVRLSVHELGKKCKISKTQPAASPKTKTKFYVCGTLMSNRREKGY